jgi:hypothetical protein
VRATNIKIAASTTEIASVQIRFLTIRFLMNYSLPDRFRNTTLRSFHNKAGLVSPA